MRNDRLRFPDYSLPHLETVDALTRLFVKEIPVTVPRYADSSEAEEVPLSPANEAKDPMQ